MKVFEVNYGGTIITVKGRTSVLACQEYGLNPLMISSVKEIK